VETLAAEVGGGPDGRLAGAPADPRPHAVAVDCHRGLSLPQFRASELTSAPTREAGMPKGVAGKQAFVGDPPYTGFDYLWD
jgi:hypothetical protein